MAERSGQPHADGDTRRDSSLAMAWTHAGVLVGQVAETLVVADGGLASLDAALERCGVGRVGEANRLGAPVIVCLGYDLGRGLEPAANAASSPTRNGHHVASSARDDRGWPSLICAVLRSPRVVSVDEACAMLSARDARNRFRVGELRSAAPAGGEGGDGSEGRDGCKGGSGGGGQDRFERGAARVLEYIRAGDVYQVNLAHRLTATFEGDPRAFMAALVRAGRPRHGAYIEFTDDAGRARVIASASPELFLEYQPPRQSGEKGTLRTRPMKGTRDLADAQAGAAAARDLAASPKDRAELAMIVDLMRNDLGRVCDLGSVRVEAAHEIERHGEAGAGLLQATATVAGTPRTHLRWSDVLAAMFPGGSVTGAPKIRAMQIIDELEEARRGPYCGSMGVFLPDGKATLNIAIRTACITGQHDATGLLRDATMDWWVGAGIVADSTPNGEWQETLAKAAVLREAMK